MKPVSKLVKSFGFIPSYRVQVRTPMTFEKTLSRAIICSLSAVILLSLASKFAFEIPLLVRTIFIGGAGIVGCLFALYSKKRALGLMLWTGAIALFFTYLFPFTIWNALSIACVLFLPIFGQGQSVKSLFAQSLFGGCVVLIGFEAVQFLNVRTALPAGELFEGALLGSFAGIAFLAKFLEIQDHRMIRGLYRMQDACETSELKDITSRTITLHAKVIKDLEDVDDSLMSEIQAKVDQLVRRISSSCKRAHHLELELKEMSFDELTKNIEICNTKIEKANRPNVISMLTKARTTAYEQKKLLDRLVQAKEEATAKALIDVTLLERLRIALLQLRTSNLTTSSPGPEITSVIEELSAEIEATCDAAEEVFYEERPQNSRTFRAHPEMLKGYQIDAVSPEVMMRR